MTVTADAAEITAALGMPPDRSAVRWPEQRASRAAAEPQLGHIERTDHGAIDQQITDVLRRNEAVSQLVRRLVAGADVEAG